MRVPLRVKFTKKCSRCGLRYPEKESVCPHCDGLTDEQVRDFQKYLIYNHSAGIGEPAPIEYVRGAMAGRINVHAHGNYGVRLEITKTLVAMLNKGVTPVVCEKGSVGACGDLSPMSQIAPLPDLSDTKATVFPSGEKTARPSLAAWSVRRRGVPPLAAMRYTSQLPSTCRINRTPGSPPAVGMSLGSPVSCLGVPPQMATRYRPQFEPEPKP